jgi:hypothetical protein
VAQVAAERKNNDVDRLVRHVHLAGCRTAAAANGDCSGDHRAASFSSTMLANPQRDSFVGFGRHAADTP